MLQCTGHQLPPCQQRITWSKMSTVPQLRNSTLDLFYYHSFSKALSWAHMLPKATFLFLCLPSQPMFLNKLSTVLSPLLHPLFFFQPVQTSVHCTFLLKLLLSSPHIQSLTKFCWFYGRSVCWSIPHQKDLLQPPWRLQKQSWVHIYSPCYSLVYHLVYFFLSIQIILFNKLLSS